MLRTKATEDVLPTPMTNVFEATLCCIVSYHKRCDLPTEDSIGVFP